MPETCANPLLLGWLKEWLDLATERNTKDKTV
jgi:crossover junction endonuclease MUS81